METESSPSMSMAQPEAEPEAEPEAAAKTTTPSSLKSKLAFFENASKKNAAPAFPKPIPSPRRTFRWQKKDKMEEKRDDSETTKSSTNDSSNDASNDNNSPTLTTQEDESESREQDVVEKTTCVIAESDADADADTGADAATTTSTDTPFDEQPEQQKDDEKEEVIVKDVEKEGMEPVATQADSTKTASTTQGSQPPTTTATKKSQASPRFADLKKKWGANSGTAMQETTPRASPSPANKNWRSKLKVKAQETSTSSPSATDAGLPPTTPTTSNLLDRARKLAKSKTDSDENKDESVAAATTKMVSRKALNKNESKSSIDSQEEEGAYPLTPGKSKVSHGITKYATNPQMHVSCDNLTSDEDNDPISAIRNSATSCTDEAGKEIEALNKLEQTLRKAALDFNAATQTEEEEDESFKKAYADILGLTKAKVTPGKTISTTEEKSNYTSIQEAFHVLKHQQPKNTASPGDGENNMSSSLNSIKSAAARASAVANHARRASQLLMEARELTQQYVGGDEIVCATPDPHKEPRVTRNSRETLSNAVSSTGTPYGAQTENVISIKEPEETTVEEKRAVVILKEPEEPAQANSKDTNQSSMASNNNNNNNNKEAADPSISVDYQGLQELVAKASATVGYQTPPESTPHNVTSEHPDVTGSQMQPKDVEEQEKDTIESVTQSNDTQPVVNDDIPFILSLENVQRHMESNENATSDQNSCISVLDKYKKKNLAGMGSDKEASNPTLNLSVSLNEKGDEVEAIDQKRERQIKVEHQILPHVELLHDEAASSCQNSGCGWLW